MTTIDGPSGNLPAAPGDSGETSFDTRQLLRTLTAHRWLIASVTGVLVAAVALYSFTTTPYYRADLRILIEHDSARVVSFQ